MSENIVVGTCPKCGLNVIEKEKLYVCSGAKNRLIDGEWINEGCAYKVFKSSLRGLGIQCIGRSSMRALLQDGSVWLNIKTKGGIKKKRIVIDKKDGIKVRWRETEASKKKFGK